MRAVWLGIALGLAACTGAGTASDGRPAATPVAAAPAPPAEVAADAPLEPQVWLSPPGHDPVAVTVELARTVEERRRGLMEREHLATDRGMLFLFERPQELSFWMRNTLIALDMIFIDAERVVLGVVENAEPQTDDPRSVPGLSQYVLEVNAGFARRHGIGPGTPVRFEGVDALEATR